MPVAGVDIGSRSTKAVIMDEGEIISSHIGDTILKGLEVGEDALYGALKKAGLTLNDIEMIMPTGYGRFRFSDGEKNISEISCHARGVHWYFPTVRTVLDIGGQDSKAINCDTKGQLTNFVLNSKCAGGTGRFLEIIADILDVPLDELGEFGARAKQDLTFSSVCVIFAKTEALNLLGEGASKNDIVAGLHNSVATIAVLMLGQISLEKDLSITGGVAKNPGVVGKIKEQTGIEPLIAPDPQLIGAIGAALFARDKLHRKGARSSKKLEQIGKSYTERAVRKES